jgi:uncharacterized protein
MALMDELKAPDYYPGTAPPKSDPRRKANDADINTVLNYASQLWPGMGFLGFPFLAELSQISEYRQISSHLAQEMTRKWIEFRSRSEKDRSDDIKQLQAAFARLEVQRAFRTVGEHDGLFGRGQLYLDFGLASDKELATPLNLDTHKIRKGGLQRLQPIEPLYSYAYDYEAGEPLDPHFYEPRTWYIMKRKVHHTRLLTFVGRPVPTMLKPMYAFSGMSMSQLAMPTVENFLKMRQSIANIVQNYSLRGIKTNLDGLLQGGTEALDSIATRLKIYTQQASNEGILVLDEESEDFFQHTTALTTLDKLLDQARDNMCAVANIPRMILFGISPEGMNATAAGELDVFEQYVSGMQETLYRHNLERVLRIVQLSEFGKIDEDITFDFVPLRTINEKDLGQIRMRCAQADNIYLSAGVVAPAEVRKKLADDAASGWNGLDVSKVPEKPAAKAPNPTGSQPNDVEKGGVE